MCNCIKIQEKNIIDHLKQKYPTRLYDEDLDGWDGTGFQNKAISLGEGGGTFLYQEFAIKHTFKKVNGEQSSPKKQTISINPAFCMFCGVKI